MRSSLPGEQPAGHPDMAERIQVSVILRHAAPVPAPAAGARRLSRERFIAQHGATDADVAAVTDFAVAHGLRVAATSPARRTIKLEGTLQALTDAFPTSVQLVSHEGRMYRAQTEPTGIPGALSDAVEGIFGFDTRPVAAPRSVFIRPEDARSSLTPLDVATLYGFPGDLNGTGQTIAIIELGGGFKSADLDAYFSSLGLTPPSVRAISVDGATNSPTGDANGPDGEVMLDIEVAGAVAPGAAIDVYFAPVTDQGFIDAVSTAALASVTPCAISISWGGPESLHTAQAITSMNSFLEDAAALGTPVCIAAGDNGSSDGLSDNLQHADFPASSPFALACGGTRLNSADAVHIDSEVVWNDSNGATGGGVSDVFPLPDYQVAAGVPPTVNPGHFAGRGLPDVAADASPDTGYQIRVDGSNQVAGGTSAVAPLWAGLIARMSQYLGDAPDFLNPLLYGDPQAQRTFNDISSGNNGSYSAAAGWDPCTGWGSPNGHALLQILANWNFAQWQTGANLCSHAAARENSQARPRPRPWRAPHIAE
jgi:kumamolisin